MDEIIPRNIDDCEILVRFIFPNCVRKQTADSIKLKDGDVFMHHKGGVSLQRYEYCDENCSIGFANKIDLSFKGLIIFRMDKFLHSLEKMKEARPDFRAKLEATPLDESNEYYQNLEVIKKSTPGNPSHADIIYVNPAPSPDETPKTAIRYFSRLLKKRCKFVPTTGEIPYQGLSFTEALRLQE